MNRVFDCIVIGTGGMGSAALYFAARRGWSVLGLDRFPAGHDRGSSHGQSRIIRQAYFEHPDYVPLVLDAYRLWDDVQRASGRRLLEPTGLLQVGRPDGPIIGGILDSAEQHHLHLESMDTQQLAARFPMFRFQQGTIGLLEPVGGLLHVEQCVTTLTALASAAGATVRQGLTVQGWQTGPDGIHVVHTDQGDFNAPRLIVTAGPWTTELPDVPLPELRVIAKHQHWFQMNDARMSLPGGCPTFFFETGDGYFYGFPDLDGRGNKIAEHSGGRAVANPLHPGRELDAGDLTRVREFVAGFVDCPLRGPCCTQRLYVHHVTGRAFHH